MSLFIGVHKLPRGTKMQQMRNAWRKYSKTCKKMKLKPISVTFSIKKRMAWCQTEARSKSEVRKAHQNLSFPLADVIEAETIK